MSHTRVRYVLDNPWRFMRQVVAGFRANQGFLLAGAIAYYTLLSIVPMFAFILIVLSQIQAPQDLLNALREYLVLLSPGQVDAVIQQLSVFLENWQVVGGIGLLILLFFSSLAFTVLENSMSVIFFHRVAVKRRHFLISAIIPYCYMLLLAAGLLLVSLVSGSLHSLDSTAVTVMGHVWSLSGSEKTRGVYTGCHRRDPAADIALPGDAGRPAGIPPCLDRRHGRGAVVGNYPARAGLVFLEPVAGQRGLWHLCHRHHYSDQSGGRGDHPAAGCTGDCRIRAHRYGIDRSPRLADVSEATAADQAVIADDSQQGPDWHLLTVAEVLARLHVDPQDGLGDAAVRERQERYGLNEIAETSRRGPWRILLGQFTDFMILVLIIAAVVSGLVGEPQDTLAIVVIVLLNAVIGALQEFRAERAVAALRAMSAPAARVRRERQLLQTPGKAAGAG